MPHGGFHADRWGWQPRILPFLEGKSEYDQYDFNIQGWQGGNYALIKAVHPAFLCPSDALSDQILEEEGFAATQWSLSQSDYGACIGDYKNATGIGATPDYGNVGFTANNGPNPRARRDRAVAVGRPLRGRDRRDRQYVLRGRVHRRLVHHAKLRQPVLGHHGASDQFHEQVVDPTRPTKGNQNGGTSRSGSAATIPAAVMFLLGDGVVRFVDENVDGVVYRAMASREGGEAEKLPPS